MKDMNQLYINSIAIRFKNQGIQQQDFLSYDQFYRIINQWNQETFDRDTFQELWDQCKLNSRGQAKTIDLITIFVRAEEVLLNKISQIQIQKTKQAKIIKNDGNLNYLKNQQINNLENQLTVLNTCLHIIRKPFTKKQLIIKNKTEHLFEANQTNQLNQQAQQEQQDVVKQIFNYDATQTSQYMTWAFYVILVSLFLTSISSFFINQFRNIISYLIICSIYFFNVLSRKLIKFCLLVIGTNIIIDIIFMILYTNTLWAVGLNYQIAQFNSGYMKFSIIFYFICLILKAVLFFLLLSQFHLDEFQSYSIHILGKNIVLQKQPQNCEANFHPLPFALRPIFNNLPQRYDK